jgi:hypothetical protein
MVELRQNYDERGLLALAFHPRIASNGRLFVHYSAPPRAAGYDNTGVVAEYRVTPGEPNSVPVFHREIITEQQPQFNHSGGTITFAPTGEMLRIVRPSDGTRVRHFLYARNYPAGTVTLGSNRDAGSNGVSMYTVILKPQGAP